MVAAWCSEVPGLPGPIAGRPLRLGRSFEQLFSNKQSITASVQVESPVLWDL